MFKSLLKRLGVVLLGAAALTVFATGSASASTSTKTSIKKWATCNGTTDDNDALARAVAAAKDYAFTLVIDCPLKIKIGQDISKPIFIDSRTNIEFTSAGKMTIDNVFIPAFVVANTINVTLTGWNVEWDASLPVKLDTGGYFMNGVFCPGSKPAEAFADIRLTNWLAANRGIVFDSRKGNVNSHWNGPTNTSAIFYVSGSAQYVTFDSMKIYAPATAKANQFIPAVFTADGDWKSRQTVNADTPEDSRYVTLPSDLTFTDISLDGTLMGWVGMARNVTVDNVTSNRYSDLQDASGNNVGGIGQWFAPPHLFYWSMTTSTDTKLWNSNIQMRNIYDIGTRLGSPRDKPGAAVYSGFSDSLKISCINCIVDTYTSNRPDGFIDVLPSKNLVISNVAVNFDSSYNYSLYSAFRWPSQNYKQVTFENVTIRDKAAVSYKQPMASAAMPGNEDITLTNVKVSLNKWGSSATIYPVITGSGISADLTFDYTATPSRAALLQKSPESVMITASPVTIKAGESTRLTWVGHNINSCSGSGAWSGNLTTGASKTIKLTKAGSYTYTAICRSSNQAATASVTVTVQ